jgi:hypothetical protein
MHFQTPDDMVTAARVLLSKRLSFWHNPGLPVIGKWFARRKHSSSDARTRQT